MGIEEDEAYNTVSAIFGKRTTGKTTFLKGSEKLGIPGFFNSYLEKEMKVLILDTIDHPCYRDVPRILPEKLHLWKQGVYRLWVRPDEMKDLNTYINELGSVWNSLLVYEDAYKHQHEKLDTPIKNLMIDSKQKNIDMLFMYHSWSMAPVDLFKMIDYIEVFKTKDHPEVRKDHMKGYYQDAVKIYNEVAAHPSRFYHQLLNTDL